MSITKDHLIYEVLLRVNSGFLTDDAVTDYGEAEVYFAAAYNYVQLGNYWIEGKAEMQHTINPLLLTAYDNISIQYSTIRRKYYATLPSPVVSLPKGRALEVSDQSGKRMIPLTQGEDSMQEYYGDYSQQIKYQLEGNKTIWFYGLEENNPLLKYIRPKYITNVYGLPGDAEILLPADGEVKLMELMYQWISGQKEMPKQYAQSSMNGGN